MPEAGLTPRLRESRAKRWSPTFASFHDGLLTPSAYGEFLGDDQFSGRPIEVRCLIVRQGSDTARVEQAISSDGGTTGETNLIAADRRTR